MTGGKVIIVVPGVSLGANGAVSAQMQVRVNRALAIFKSTKGAICILSGGVTNPQYDSEAHYMAELLKMKGVPESCLFQEDQATNTLENAFYIASIIKEKFGADNVQVIACTERYHYFRFSILLYLFGIRAKQCNLPSSLDANSWGRCCYLVVREMIASPKDLMVAGVMLLRQRFSNV